MRVPTVVQILACVVIGISLTTLAAHLGNLWLPEMMPWGALHQWLAPPPMAVNTAACFFMMGLGQLLITTYARKG